MLISNPINFMHVYIKHLNVATSYKYQTKTNSN